MHVDCPLRRLQERRIEFVEAVEDYAKIYDEMAADYHRTLVAISPREAIAYRDLYRDQANRCRNFAKGVIQ